VQLAVFRLDPLGFGRLGQASPAVLQPGEFRVQIGQLEQPLLRLGRCFHGSPR
jgi:hypothetical protein